MIDENKPTDVDSLLVEAKLSVPDFAGIYIYYEANTDVDAAWTVAVYSKRPHSNEGSGRGDTLRDAFDEALVDARQHNG